MDEMNIVTAVFADGSNNTFANENLYQYDYGQILKIEGAELPSTFTVEFCNVGDEETIQQIGSADGVTIPDNFLQTGKDIEAYIFLHTGEDDGETEYKITILVYPKPEQGDEEPTPAQQSVIDQLIVALNSGVEHVDAVAEQMEESQITVSVEDGILTFKRGANS